MVPVTIVIDKSRSCMVLRIILMYLKLVFLLSITRTFGVLKLCILLKNQFGY